MLQERYDTFGRRFGAGFIDGLIFMPLSILGSFAWSHHDSIPPAILALWYVFRRVYHLVANTLDTRMGFRLFGLDLVPDGDRDDASEREAPRPA